MRQRIKWVQAAIDSTHNATDSGLIKLNNALCNYTRRTPVILIQLIESISKFTSLSQENNNSLEKYLIIIIVTTISLPH